MTELRVSIEEERVKMSKVFQDWNQRVYQAFETTLEGQRLAYEKELDAKHQRCMELEKLVAELSGPVQEKLIQLQKEGQEKDLAMTEIMKRVEVLEESVQMVKEIYNKTLENTNELREKMETILEHISLKGDDMPNDKEGNEDIRECLLMNRLETFRAEQAKPAAGVTPE